MKDWISRNTLVIPILLTGVYVLIDLLVDQGGNGDYFAWVHLVVGAMVLVVSGVLLARATRATRHAETLLQQARAELEARVAERTGQLERANDQLQAQVAERTRVEQALRVSEETARALMNASSESAVLIDTDGMVVIANETAAEGLGLSIEQMLGKPLFEFFPQQVADLRRSYLQQVLATGQPVHFEDVRDGRSFDIHARPVCNTDGDVIRIAAFGLDVTEHKRAEMALRASEEKYRLLFQNMAEGFALYELLDDEDGKPSDWKVLEVNAAYTRHTGLSPSQVVGRRMSELFPAAVPEYLPRFAAVIASGIPASFETRATSVGRYQRVSTFAAGGRRFASTIEDISARWQAEQELRSSEEKFAKSFRCSPDAIALVRADTGLMFDVNPACTKLLGYERSEMIGRTAQELRLASMDAAGRIAELFAAAGEVTDLEVELYTRSGAVATALMSIIPFTVNDQPCVMVIAHDITARKQSEEALRTAQAEVARGIEARVALEERQRLSRELHDSVSQALYGISLGINTARTRFDSDPPAAREALDYSLSLTRAGLAEMRALIFELRPDSLEHEGLVAALTKQAEAMRARHGFEVGLRLSDEPPVPLVVKEALYRIAQEALQNAVKHARSDRLEISLAYTMQRVVLEVSDNGAGFDASGEYPGHLGLQTMRERAEGVGGTLRIASAPDCGTQVIASVPR